MSAPRLQTYCDAATSFRESTRLPQQDAIHDASTSGFAETSGKRCSAGLCRDTKPKSPQRHGRKIRLPRQRVRNDAATSQANSYNVHSTRHDAQEERTISMHGNLSAARRLLASDAGSQSVLPVLGLVPCVRGLARAFMWGIGMNCTRSNYDRSYAVTT